MKPTPERQLWGIVLAAGEGTRVREFLAQMCGGRGIKQFCAVTGRRSMLQHTLDRAERLIPRERLLVVVSTEHRAEVEAQLAHWPAENNIFQPANRDASLRLASCKGLSWNGATDHPISICPVRTWVKVAVASPVATGCAGFRPWFQTT